jgi:Neuraminidase-like domain
MTNLSVPSEGSNYRVDGKVISRRRQGVGGLRVQILRKKVGAEELLAEVTTSDDGTYLAEFSFPEELPDLQARVFKGETILCASEVRYNASHSETLDIVLTAVARTALPSEYETLIGNLASHFSGSLSDLAENDQRQDITYLANKTGWDARAVAFAALADQFSTQTSSQRGQTAGLAAPFFYALFRAGLPADEIALYQADTKSVVGIWERATEQGVIDNTLAEDISKATESFLERASQIALDVPVTGGLSPLKELLSVSGIDDEKKQRQFANLYARHRNDPAQFWEAVGEAFPEDEQRLKLDGKLARLTLNNASLVRKVRDAIGQNDFADPLQLVEHGFFRNEKWHEVIGTDPVPSGIAGEDADKQRSQYAHSLAAQVRLSYPTAVVAQMVKSGDIPLAATSREGKNVQEAVFNFLTEHHGKFEIGAQPIEQFLQNNQQLSPDETNGVALTEIAEEIKRIQRVYQITPSDRAMNALLRNGLDSAYAVVSYGQNEFVRAFKDELGEAQAKLTYAKAEQVHFATLNIATSYALASIAPSLGASSAQIVPSGSDTSDLEARAKDVIAYPTLEGLFGEMDYCECAHCRSVLSPAAYLVDLLKFLDPEPGAWKHLMDEWPSAHGGAPYPFSTTVAWTNAGSPEHTDLTPLQVLLSRRPDVAYLPLTCENTNRPLPYIDVANETLEYFVYKASGFADYEGHSTEADIEPEELLASPQYVIDSSYETLKTAWFPPPLPFDQPVESLRRYFDRFKTSLSQVMEVLRKNDNVERDFQDEYCWRDILLEELRLSRSENTVLTNHAPDPPFVPLTLKQLFGYKNETPDQDVMDDLGSAKNFARRVGISYDELIEILTTRFVNPNSILLPKVKRLGVSFSALKELKESPLTDEAWLALLAEKMTQAAAPSFPEPLPDASQYGGSIEQWLKDEQNFARIMGLVTLTTPILPRRDSKVYRLGDCIRPNLPVPLFGFYECTAAGISAAAAPGEWSNDPGETVTDGEVSWTYRPGVGEAGFQTLRFRYVDPDKIEQNVVGFEFHRMLRFIRLWKKLGWSIEHTDKTVVALYPAEFEPNDPDESANWGRLDNGFLAILLRLGVLKRVMKVLNLKPDRDLFSLLACYAPIDTWGKSSLYRQMFLSPALLKLDPVFVDDGYGNFLSDPAAKLINHTEALRGAFQLTELELSRILDSYFLFDASAFTQFNDLASKLRNPTDPLSIYLRNQFSENTRELLNTFDPSTGETDLQDALIIELNKLIKGPSLFDEQRFAGVDLSDQVLELIAKHPQGTTVIALNRMLLEEAYADEIEQSSVLSLPNVSEIFRNGWLARQLKLSAHEFLALKRFTGINPFEAPEPPHLPALRFTEFINRLSAAGLKPVQALSLIWNQDMSGKQAPDDNTIRTLADSLHSGFEVINREFSVVDDPDGTIAREKIALVFDNEVTEFFFGLLANTVVTEVVYSHPNPTLDQAILNVAPGRIAYDDVRKRLSFTGSLTAQIRDDLKNASPSVSSDFKAALDDLHEKNQKLIKPHPKLQPLYEAYDFFTHLISTAPYSQNGDKLDLAIQRAGLGRLAYDPILKLLRYHGVLTDQIRDNLKAVPNVQDNFKTSVDLLYTGNQGTIDAFFVKHENLKPQKDVYVVANNSLDQQRRLILETFLPELREQRKREAALQIISATAQSDLELTTLLLNNQKVLHAAGDPNRPVLDDFLKGTVPTEPLGPNESLDPALKALRDAFTRFLKATSLTTGLRLTPTEIIHFASHATYQINDRGWLNSLPVSGDPDDDTAHALYRCFAVLLDFALLKRELSPDDERLITVLKDPATATADDNGLLFKLTRWTPDSLNTIRIHFEINSIGGLSDLEVFRRVYDAHRPLQQIGISATALVSAAVNNPTAKTVRDFQSGLRARYDPASWLGVLKPINDEMRTRQRDALVSYILHQMTQQEKTKHIDTPEKLFEYFLMDVQMEPCMQTSRIRHALSSVQLFIDRCLMNLEPQVSPSVIKAKQWEWMQRYRVWEANRKVFLWPENWLEPELRDDQSPFFRETMSELLQSDITEDRAAEALLNYLAKLEEVAKLEPCGIYYVEGDSAADDDITHVIARTAGAKRKYFYRRRESGSWMPWEQISLDIDDNPVVPVVWKGRLLLFWLKIVQRPSLPAPPPHPRAGSTLFDLDPSTLIGEEESKITVQAILCWSEYYNGKWQPTRTSDINDPAQTPASISVKQGTNFRRPEIVMLALEEDNSLRLIFWSDQHQGAFRLFNMHSLPLVDDSTFSFPSGQFRIVRRSELTGESDPTIGAKKLGEILVSDYHVKDLRHPIFRFILNNPIAGNVTQRVLDGWYTPFLYEDNRHVFYITTSVPSNHIADWDRFGIIPSVDRSLIAIPAIETTPVRIADSALVERRSAADQRRMARVISGNGTVRYGDKEIGPASVGSNRQRR